MVVYILAVEYAHLADTQRRIPDGYCKAWEPRMNFHFIYEEHARKLGSWQSQQRSSRQRLGQIAHQADRVALWRRLPSVIGSQEEALEQQRLRVRARNKLLRACKGYHGSPSLIGLFRARFVGVVEGPLMGSYEL